MKTVIIIILLFASICFSDVYTSHQKPTTDSSLDIGTSSLFWRYIYGDAFTDGTASWLNNNLSGFTLISGTTLSGTNLTDTVLSITGGSITSAIDSTFSGTIAGGIITGVNVTSGNNPGHTHTYAFEVDINGDLMPITDSFTDQYFELDGNDDIEPKAS